MSIIMFIHTRASAPIETLLARREGSFSSLRLFSSSLNEASPFELSSPSEPPSQSSHHASAMLPACFCACASRGELQWVCVSRVSA